MKPHNLHVLTQVFPAAAAICTRAAAGSRPQGEPLSPGIFGDKFMSGHPGKNQIRVALMPHLGIGAANSAILNPEAFETFPGFRFRAVLHLQASESGKQHSHFSILYVVVFKRFFRQLQSGYRYAVKPFVSEYLGMGLHLFQFVHGKNACLVKLAKGVAVSFHTDVIFAAFYDQ
jgi:hypothetical protein